MKNLGVNWDCTFKSYQRNRTNPIGAFLRVVRRGAIVLDGVSYGSELLVRRHGEIVKVKRENRFDTTIVVFDLDGNVICCADCN